MPPVQVQHRSTASRASSAFDPWQPPQGAPMVATGTPPASPVGSVAAPPAAEVDESTKGVRLAAAAVDEAGDVCVAAKEAAGVGLTALSIAGLTALSIAGVISLTMFFVWGGATDGSHPTLSSAVVPPPLKRSRGIQWDQIVN